MSVEFDVWWLLVGVALFAFGWFAARVDIKLLVKESRTLPGWYFEGLNHLLNNAPKQAIESFEKVVIERPETLELQFALGQLFRKQGEIERATRIHRSLLDRPHLTVEHRQRATYALAQDYNAAGLLDRAETHFKQLDGTAHEPAALAFLARIYEMEKDWPQAIAISRRIEAISKTPAAVSIAQYHCELASAAMLKDQLDVADQHLNDAFAANKRCVRANVIRGDVAILRGNTDAAISAWLGIEAQQPDSIGLVSDRLARAYLSAGRAEEGARRLAALQSQSPSQDVLAAALETTRAAHGAARAEQLLRDELKRTPTLSGLAHLLASHPPEAPASDAALAHDVLKATTRAAGTYPCRTCGFRARTYYWQCPGCVQWESFVPKRQEALDVR